jgi:hypothetical protein
MPSTMSVTRCVVISATFSLEAMAAALNKHVKVTFFRGTSLRPLPPGGTERSKDARWIDIREDDQLDEAQLATWIKQAAALPGWIP